MDILILGFAGEAVLTRVDLTGPVLRLTGTDFIDVQSVTVNGVESPEWIVYSATRIDAQIPTSQIGQMITEIQVLRSYLGASERVSVSFTLGRRMATGATLLVQRFLKLLLTTPGTDLFAPLRGGGLAHAVRVGGNERTLRAYAANAVQRTTEQLLLAQMNRSLPAEERLQSAQLLGASFAGDTLSVQIQLTSMQGASVTTGVTLATV